LVTGGASAIGSHLVDRLVGLGAQVRVVDDLSSGERANLEGPLAADAIELIVDDLRELSTARRAMKDIEVVFHLAADHGGRGYLDLHPADCAGNFLLDGAVFTAARLEGTEKVVFASSGCVYPNHLQSDPGEVLYLSEDLVQPPFDADNTYGWAKLMAEQNLRALHQQYGLASVSCRYFTVYGERTRESHAVLAMIARAFTGQDPFEVWGTGEQIRNWTHVSDIVTGTILAAERIDDARAVNLGTTERVRVLDAVHMVLDRLDHHPRIELLPEMPTGPYNRVADNSLAERELGWSPQIDFATGLARTIDWYCDTKDRATVAAQLEELLTER
jgi:nucleoside-diphosphate-sugar epimerase